MDAHVFRRIAVNLAGLLGHARIEKIFRPAKDVFVFSLYSGQRKVFLFFRHGRRNQALFLSYAKPQAPAIPDSEVMLFRKHFAGRRIVSVAVDWPRRRILLRFTSQSDCAGKAQNAHGESGPIHIDLHDGHAYGENRFSALLLDMREGARALDGPPADFGAFVEWPRHLDPDFVLEDASRIWEKFPAVTPLLRKTVAALDVFEANALLADLESESTGAAWGDTWVYAPKERDAGETLVSAWPLPETLRAGLREYAFNDALEASAHAWAEAVFAHIADERDKARVQGQSRELKRLKQALQKLELEEKRLNAFLERKRDALLLQAHLHAFEKGEHRESVVLPTAGAQREVKRHITLNPRLTVRENMLHMFHQAAKATRGFAHLKRRRQELERAMTDTLRRRECLEASGSVPPALLPENGKNIEGAGDFDRKSRHIAEKQVSAFVSSDGFLLLRGRSAKGNRAALKMAAPYDYWFHCEDGPSAHLIVRRKHAAQSVPERTMREAAGLVAVKSWRRHDSGARIMYALARDVQPIKGGPDGKVKVVRSMGSYMVPLEPELEMRLERVLK